MFEPLAHYLFLYECVHGEVFADVAEEFDEFYLSEPIGVVDGLHRRTDQPRNLRLYLFRARGDFACVHERPLTGRLRVADKTGAPTDKQYHFVSVSDEMPQHHVHGEIPHMDGIGGGVDAQIHRTLFFIRDIRDGIARVLVNEPPRCENFRKLHAP